MSKTPLLIATAFAVCATTLIADHAQAREPEVAQGGFLLGFDLLPGGHGGLRLPARKAGL